MAIKTKYWIMINGEFCDQDSSKISVLDRGFLYGDSVYEVTRTYNKVPLFLEDHLQRLHSSANRIYMPLELSDESLKNMVKRTLERSGLSEAYIRIIITRGEGEISLDLKNGQAQNVVIISKEQKSYPESWYEKGVKLAMTDIVRNAPEAMDPNIKSGNYLNNVLAFKAASEMNAHESVMLNDKGMVTECTTSNIWIVKDKKIITPPIKAGLLEGITRQKLLEIGKAQNLEMQEKLFGRDELLNADECFITSSTREVLPVTSINDQKISDGNVGPTAKHLLKSYRELKDEYIKNYQ